MTFQELMSTPTFWMFLIVGIVGIVGAIRVGRLPKKTKKVAGYGKGLALTFLLIVGLGGLYLSDIGSLTNQAILESPLTAAPGIDVPTQPLAIGDAQIIEDDSGTTCQPGVSVEDTTITLAAIDRYTSAAAGGTHGYRINGGSLKTVSDAGTFTASPGDALSILFMNADRTSSYFSTVQNVVVPCKGTKEYTAEVIGNATITVQVKNEESLVMTYGDNNETLAAGDVVDLDIEIKGQFQKGMPYGGDIVAEYNKSNYDEVWIDMNNDGISDEVPVFTNYSRAFGAIGEARQFPIPAVLSNEKIFGNVHIDASDTQNPSGGTGLDENTHIQMTLWAKNYFVNNDTGNSFDGPSVEDEDNELTANLYSNYTIFVD